MAKLTIGRMAKLYGLHRSTLHEAVAKGRVTAGLDGKGQKIIDLSEMIRVYGEPQSTALHRPTPSDNSSHTPETIAQDSFMPLLVEEIRLLRVEIQELRESLRLIEHKPDPLSIVAPPEPRKSKGPATWASIFDALDD
jgi:hypothetical protein